MQTARLQSILRCPDCRGLLSFSSDSALGGACDACCSTFGGSDFRPRRASARNVPLPAPLDVEELIRNVHLGPPPLTYKGPAPPRNCVDVLSGLEGVAPAKCGRPPLLDIGSGPADARTAIEWMGYDWVGVDVPPSEPLVVADAHALPFASESFGAAFSLAVLEHLHSPFLAVAEVQRVLAPGAPFVGVAAFGEPFHASYFHMSHWGLVSLLHACGFKVTTIWPCRDSLGALAGMGGYPRVIRSLLTALGHLARVPFLSPRRWVRGDGGRARLSVAGSLGFVALKA